MLGGGVVVYGGDMGIVEISQGGGEVQGVFVVLVDQYDFVVQYWQVCGWCVLKVVLGDVKCVFGYVGGVFMCVVDVDQQCVVGEMFVGLGGGDFGDRVYLCIIVQIFWCSWVLLCCVWFVGQWFVLILECGRVGLCWFFIVLFVFDVFDQVMFVFDLMFGEYVFFVFVGVCFFVEDELYWGIDKFEVFLEEVFQVVFV